MGGMLCHWYVNARWLRGPRTGFIGVRAPRVLFIANYAAVFVPRGCNSFPVCRGAMRSIGIAAALINPR